MNAPSYPYKLHSVHLIKDFRVRCFSSLVGVALRKPAIHMTGCNVHVLVMLSIFLCYHIKYYDYFNCYE